MSDFCVKFSLSFHGGRAEGHQLDFYDISYALLGFQRSLALTTHLVLNNEIITQAPSLKGAVIFAEPPQKGSWEIIVTIIGGIGYLATRPKDTPIGHLIYSAYDFIVSQILGFHVDYDKSLYQQYKSLRGHKEIIELDEARFDSLAEKCESAIRDMHRPIVSSRTAKQASISVVKNKELMPFNYKLNEDTYEHIRFTRQRDNPEYICGRVSSYNINTFRGRVYIDEYKRPIPFYLSDAARSQNCIDLIADSLTANARDQSRHDGTIVLKVIVCESRIGRVKNLIVLDVFKDKNRY